MRGPQSHRPRPRRRIFAAFVALVAATAPLGAALATSTPAPAADAYTPLVQSVMSTPHWFRGVDGHVHLVYELELVNGFQVPVTLESVTIRDPSRGDTVALLSGTDLRASMSLLASPTEPTTTVPSSGIGVVWFDITLPNPRALPRSIEHTLTVKVPAGLPVPEIVTYHGAIARVDLRPPVVLGPPLSGPGWIAVGSCCDGPHRRSIQPVNGRLYLGQRFAIDWNGFDSMHRFVVGNPERLTSWVFYGKPVLAVADAEVVAAVDRFPDQTPNHPRPVTLEEADGNYIILALGQGRFAFYAHLKPGSVRVRVGERVHRGEVIAQLGNSGSSTGPHLHFQVMDRPSALASNGLPYVFDSFQFVGRIPPLDTKLEDAVNAGQPVPVDPTGAGTRHAELPLGRDVINFGSG
jgi:Peptidase family M23